MPSRGRRVAKIGMGTRSTAVEPLDSVSHPPLVMTKLIATGAGS